MTAPLFVEPVFKERVWGGTTLREWYPDLVPPGTIGEAWALSGLPGDSGNVTDGPGSGGTLADAWRDGLVSGRPERDDFPLLAKLLDPTDWLSVQVHPDDEHAMELLLERVARRLQGAGWRVGGVVHRHDRYANGNKRMQLFDLRSDRQFELSQDLGWNA